MMNDEMEKAFAVADKVTNHILDTIKSDVDELKKLRKEAEKEMNKINNFKEELLTLFEKYGYSISHEDTQGGFELVDFNSEDNDWLLDFSDKTTKKECVE